MANLKKNIYFLCLLLICNAFTQELKYLRILCDAKFTMKVYIVHMQYFTYLKTKKQNVQWRNINII